MFSFIKDLMGIEELNFKELFEREALIVDVRTIPEFRQGHADGSINIPLNHITESLQEFKNKGVPIITCCRSGARSGSAAKTLKKLGIEAYNGGSWNEVQQAIDSLKSK